MSFSFQMTAASDEISPLLGQTQPASYNGNGRDVSSVDVEAEAEEQLEEPKKLSSYFVYVSAFFSRLVSALTKKLGDTYGNWHLPDCNGWHNRGVL